MLPARTQSGTVNSERRLTEQPRSRAEGDHLSYVLTLVADLVSNAQFAVPYYST